MREIYFTRQNIDKKAREIIKSVGRENKGIKKGTGCTIERMI